MKYKGTAEDHFKIINHGSLFLFKPITDWAKEWWEEKVDPNCPTFGDGYAVEHRYAEDIIEGIKADLVQNYSKMPRARRTIGIGL